MYVNMADASVNIDRDKATAKIHKLKHSIKDKYALMPSGYFLKFQAKEKTPSL